MRAKQARPFDIGKCNFFLSLVDRPVLLEKIAMQRRRLPCLLGPYCSSVIGLAELGVVDHFHVQSRKSQSLVSFAEKGIYSLQVRW